MGTRIAVLHAGVLQQVGPPLAVYERPVNVFVANFIGTPPMNLFPASVTGGGATLTAGTFSIPTPGAWRAATAGTDGRELVIGVRPEKIGLARDDASGPGVVPAVVEMVELLGDEVVFHTRVGRDTLIAKAEPRHAPSVGGSVLLRLDLDELHLFDAETQRRLE